MCIRDSYHTDDHLTFDHLTTCHVHLGPEDVQTGVESISAHQHLGNKVFLTVEKLSHHLHADGKSVHDSYVSVKSFVHEGLRSFTYLVLFILNDILFEFVQQFLQAFICSHVPLLSSGCVLASNVRYVHYVHNGGYAFRLGSNSCCVFTHALRLSTDVSGHMSHPGQTASAPAPMASLTPLITSSTVPSVNTSHGFRLPNNTTSSPIFSRLAARSFFWSTETASAPMSAISVMITLVSPHMW